MEDAALYTSFLINFLYATSMLAAVMSRVRTGLIAESVGKSIYTIAVTMVGVLCGAAAFPGLVYVYSWAGMPQSLGHGEVVVAALTLNFLFAMALAAVGRVVIGWQPVRR